VATGLLAIVTACGGVAKDRGIRDAGLPADGWELVPELTIGGAEEGPASFSEIRMLAVDGAGRIYVLEPKDHEARLFGPDGSFIRRFGGWGEGPAEFQNPNGIVVDHQDRAWVYVPRLQRLALFDSAGTFLRTRPHQYGSVGPRLIGDIDSTGRFLVSELVRRDTTFRTKLLRVDWASGVTDTLDWPDCGVPYAKGFTFPRGWMPLPFAAGRFERLDGRGFTWCADAAELRIHQYRVGDSIPLRTLLEVATPVPVAESERDSAIAQAEAFKKLAGPASLDYSMIPTTKPVLQDLAMDEMGRVWVVAETVAGLRLHGFQADGTPLGSAPLTVAVATRGPPMVVRNGRVHLVTLDQDEVPSVRVFRIRPRSPISQP